MEKWVMVALVAFGAVALAAMSESAVLSTVLMLGVAVLLISALTQARKRQR